MACSCDVGLSNTGTPNCQPIATVARKLIIVPLFKDDGTQNSIDTTVALDQSAWDGKINASDSSERFFPLPNMENITQERADSIFETAASGRTAFIRKGIKSFAGEMWKQSPTLLGKLEDARCIKIGAYVVDKDENLIGYCPDGGTLLYPIPIDNESFDPQLVDATDALVQKVSLGFNWDDDTQDKYLKMITASEYTADIINSKGLLDVSATYSSITTAGFTATLTTAYGSKISPIKVKGLVLGDFAVNELSPTPGSVALTSVTESADGVYDIVFTTPETSADVLELVITKNGFDFSAVQSSTITIP